MKDNKPEYFLIIENKFILMDIDNIPNLDKDSYFDMNVFSLANNKELLNKLKLLYCDYKELPWSKNTPEKIFNHFCGYLSAFLSKDSDYLRLNPIIRLWVLDKPLLSELKNIIILIF